MAKFNFVLGALPDFKLPVKFTMPNGEDAKIVFTVRHLSSAEVQEMYSKEDGMKDNEFITRIASGWDLEEEFNEENAAKLVQFYPSSAYELTAAYMKALAGQRAKN